MKLGKPERGDDECQRMLMNGELDFMMVKSFSTRQLPVFNI